MEEKGRGVKRPYSGVRVIVDNPGFVAAVGEIPDELNPNGEISFFSCATFKYLPSEDHKVFVDAYKEAMGENIMQVLNKAQEINISSISRQSDEGKQRRNIDKKPPTMVEVNLDVSTSLDNFSFISKEESESKEGTHKTTHKIDRDFCPQSIPEPGYFPRTLCDSRVHALTRDCGDSIEIVLYKGVIINKPGIVVAAVGGIPDELKIKDGLSFSYPCPSIKICKYLTYDNGKLHKLHFDPFDGAMEKNAFVETLQQGYNKARGISWSSSKVQKKKAHTKDQESLSLAMMEVNVDPSVDHIFQWSRKDDVFHGYSLLYARNGVAKVLQRDGGDYFEFFYYKGVLANIPGICVIAAGGIPDELKFDGGLSVFYPCPAVKVRKDLLRDPAQRQKAMDDAYHETWGTHACNQAIRQAREKKWFSPGSISEQSGNMDRQPLSMIEVNIAPRTGSSSHELNSRTAT